MTFKEFDAYNRQFEQNSNHSIPPLNYIIVRLDGRGFSKLTKETCSFNRPFDERFSDLMVETTEYLVNNSGFNVAYAYTQSDEISILLNRDDTTFDRRPKKILTTFASMASVYFSMNLDKQLQIEDIYATFDATLDIRPTIDSVFDYFVWRQEDSARNCLNNYAYWTLRDRDKMSARKAGSTIENKGNDFKNELLFNHGINFDKVPAWQKRGTALYKVETTRTGVNHITGEKTTVKRKVIKIDYDLPLKDDYKNYIKAIID
jgi:tRNA(His) 5'-end guanylyltransferase